MSMFRRRRFLQTMAAGTTVGVAGCIGGNENGTDRPGPEDDEEYEELGTVEWIGISRDEAPLRYEAQSMAADMWEPLGIDINLDIRNLSGLFDRWTERDFDVLTLWTVARPDRLDPTFMMVFNFHSDYADEGENAIQFRNDEYDELADRIRTEMDEDERQQVVYEAQEMLADLQPALFLYHQDIMSAANTTTYTNWEQQIGAYPYWNLHALDSIEPVDDEDQFTLASLEEPTTAHPMAIQGNAATQATKMVFSRLVRYNLDGEPEPFAASEVEVLDDTTVEATIRDDMVFHDGEPLTPEDVQFTMEYYLEWDVPYLAGFYDVIDNVEVVDDDAVRFNLERPDASFSSVALSQLNILPEHIWSDVVDEEGVAHPEEWTESEAFIGSGPFEFVTFDQGDQIVYETFDDHPVVDMAFDTLVYSLYGSESTAYGAVEQGESDAIQNIQATHFEQAEDNDDLAATASESHGTTQIWLQNERDPFSDPEFRRALSHALDREQIVNTVLEGQGQVATSQISPANEFWHNPDLPEYDGGVDEAVELLTEVGYRWSDNGDLLVPTSRFE